MTKYIITAIAVAAVWFLAGVFIAAEVNPFEWGEAGRAGFVFALFVFEIAAFCFCKAVEND